MKGDPYHKREWLNPEGIPASSQITAFHGNHLLDYAVTKLIISDCNNSIQIHKSSCETTEMYIEKLRLIANVCNEFADHLEL